MAKTILEIVRAVSGEMNLQVPSNVVSSLDKNVVQLKYLTIAACDELADGYDWQQLLSTHTFSTEDGVTEYDLPTDYLRIVSNASWDRTAANQMTGNVSTQRWEQLRSGVASSGPTYRFRLVGGQIQLSPTPGSTTSTLAFNYFSNKYVVASAGTRKQEFTADDDTTVFHDRLLINFVKLKLLQVKGFNTEAAASDFNMTLAAVMANDVPVAPINMSGSSFQLLSECNIPDGSYGG